MATVSERALTTATKWVMETEGEGNGNSGRWGTKRAMVRLATKVMAMVTTGALVVAMMWWVRKWAIARATRVIVTNAVPPLLSSLPLLSRQPPSLLLLPPQSLNAIALSAAIAAAVAIAHLSDTAIKWQWRG